MDIAEVISYNLTRLMSSSVSLNTLVKVSKASKVGFGTVRRAKNGDGNITVSNLEMIAAAFNRKAVDLLTLPIESYQPAIKILPLKTSEPHADEQEVILGYRVASEEVREVILDLARKAAKKASFEQRSESND